MSRERVEFYRQRFRSGQKKAGEAYGELAVRLHDLARKWLAGCGTVEEVLERLVVEQLANTMPTEIRVWVAERKPQTGAEAGRLADDYRLGSGGEPPLGGGTGCWV